MVTSLARRLLDRYQKGLPVCSRPYAAMAAELGVTESEVINCLQHLQQDRVITRVGPVFDHHKAGASTLAALAVPPERLQSIADYVSHFDGVNHNYAREHDYNLWFVVTAGDQEALQRTLRRIETETQMPMLVLPMEKGYHIDLGFKLAWSEESR